MCRGKQMTRIISQFCPGIFLAKKTNLSSFQLKSLKYQKNLINKILTRNKFDEECDSVKRVKNYTEPK